MCVFHLVNWIKALGRKISLRFFLNKNLNIVKFFNFNDKASEEKQYIFLDTSFLDRLSAK